MYHELVRVIVIQKETNFFALQHDVALNPSMCFYSHNDLHIIVMFSFSGITIHSKWIMYEEYTIICLMASQYSSENDSFFRKEIGGWVFAVTYS